MKYIIWTLIAIVPLLRSNIITAYLDVFCAKNLPNILRKYIAKTKYILNISFQNGHHFRIG